MFTIAFRNLLRQKRRSLLTALTMGGGFVLASLSIAWADGTYNDVIRMFTHSRLGDIQVHAAGYLDSPSIYRNLEAYESIGEALEGVPHVEGWTPRILAGALASAGNRTAAVQVIGIDAGKEAKASGFERKIKSGTGFSAGGANEAVIGIGVSRLLRAGPGSEVVVLSQAADGSIANDLYTVVGITESGDPAKDRTDFYLRLPDAQELFVLQGRVHEIAVLVDRMKHVRRSAEAIAGRLDNPSISVEPWQEFAREFYEAMQADLQGMWIMLFIISVIVAIGVLNTVLMSVLERRREYGVLLALGTRPAGVFGMVLTETAILAAISVAVGAAVALIVNYLLSIHGVSLPHPYSFGGMTFERFRTEVNLRSILLPAATVILAAVGVAVGPGWKAAHTSAARSMKMH